MATTTDLNSVFEKSNSQATLGEQRGNSGDKCDSKALVDNASLKDNKVIAENSDNTNLSSSNPTISKGATQRSFLSSLYAQNNFGDTSRVTNPFVYKLTNQYWMRLNYYLEGFLIRNKRNPEVIGILKILLSGQSTEQAIQNAILHCQHLSTVTTETNEINVDALYLMGCCHFYGLGLKEDKALGLKLIEQASLKEYPPAIFHLGCSFDTGDGIKEDREKALQYFNQAGIVHQYAPAQTTLGYLYGEGVLVAVDKKKGAEFNELAAKQGHAMGQFNCAQRLYDRNATKEGFHFLVQSMAQGCKIAFDQFVENFENILPQTFDKAINVLKKVHSQLNHDQYKSIGLYLLGVHYNNEANAVKDAKNNAEKEEWKVLTEKSEKCMQQAAALGHPEALYLVARTACANKDIKRGIECLMVATKYRAQNARHMLAKLYFEHKEIPSHMEKSALLYLLTIHRNEFDPTLESRDMVNQMKSRIFMGKLRWPLGLGFKGNGLPNTLLTVMAEQIDKFTEAAAKGDEKAIDLLIFCTNVGILSELDAERLINRHKLANNESNTDANIADERSNANTNANTSDNKSDSDKVAQKEVHFVYQNPNNTEQPPKVNTSSVDLEKAQEKQDNAYPPGGLKLV